MPDFLSTLRTPITLDVVWIAWGIAGFVGPVLMGRAFDATGSYEMVLLGFAIGSVAVATLMLLVPEPVAAGCAGELAGQGGS